MSVNKVILIGRLGSDPTERVTNSGSSVCNLNLATKETWIDKDGARQEKTEWHRVIFYGKTAVTAAKYLKKGREVYVEGSIQTNKWKDKDGQERTTTEIKGQTLQFIGSIGKSDSGSPEVHPGLSEAGAMPTPDFGVDEIPF